MESIPGNHSLAPQPSLVLLLTMEIRAAVCWAMRQTPCLAYSVYIYYIIPFKQHKDLAKETFI